MMLLGWLINWATVIRKHIPSGRTTFFGNLTSAYGRSKHHFATEPPFLGNDGGVSQAFSIDCDVDS